MKQDRLWSAIVVFLLALLALGAVFFVMLEEVGAQGEFPLSNGVCGPVPTGTVVTVQSFVARTGPMTQAPGSGASVPAGTSFPVGQLVCDEGITFVAVNWDGQPRWLPSTWPTFNQVWRELSPTTTPFPTRQSEEPAATPAGGTCTPFLLPGLMVGGFGEVLTNSVNLRETAGGVRRGTLYNGEVFRVVGGPIPTVYLGLCFNWWQVQTPEGDLGWIAEGSRWRLIGPSSAAG